MKLKGFIENVGPLTTGTNAEGKPWQKRVVTLNHQVTFDNGKQVSERILTEYFGDASQEELLQLAADKVSLDLTLWFNIREYTDRVTLQTKQIQSITLKNLSRSI